MILQAFGYVYILTNKNKTVLYVGSTNNIFRRVMQHKEGNGSLFTSKYNLDLLVYYKSYNTIEEARSKEANIKN